MEFDSIRDKKYYESVYYADMERLVYDVEERARRLHEYRVKKILGLYTPTATETVMDLGCAWGTLTLAVAPYCRLVIGTDFSFRVLSFSRKRALQKGISNLRLLCSDAQIAPVASGKIDTVISADLVEHLYPDQFDRMVDECHRILAPGGRLILFTPHRGHVLEILKNRNIILKRDESHVDYKSMRRMTETLKNRGFRIVQARYFESHIPLFRVLEGLLMSVMPLLRRRIGIVAQKL